VARKVRQNAQLHPVVAAYCSSNTDLIDILKAQHEPREPVVQAMLDLRESYTGRVTAGDALRNAGSVVLKHVDSSLVAMFLYMWSGICGEQERYDEARALSKRAQSLMSSGTPSEIAMAVAMNAVNAARWEGNHELARRLLSEALEKLPRSSPRWFIWALVRLQICAWEGLLGAPDLQKELAGIEREAEERYAVRLAAVRFYHAAEMCLPEEAFRFSEMVKADPEYRTIYAQPIDDRLALMRCLHPTGEADAVGPYRRAGTTRWLLAGRTDEALAAARSLAAQSPATFIATQGLNSYDLVRAELACRNAEAAHRVLAQRREKGNLHPYMDDFLLARAELLAGRRESAARHYTAAIGGAGLYEARSRLDFELRLSLELSAADAVWLETQARARAVPHAPSGETAPLPPAAAPERGLDRLVGASPAMARVRQLVGHFAAAEAPVLLTGETGTGKELVARAIHESKPQSGQPFLAVNCGAITESLLESELFGHARGAFTGAERAHRGLFEEAGLGTILLDEIGDIPPRLQVALLRVLEVGEIRPVGAAEPRRISCRIVAATNADLARLVRAGSFREDLMFRLKRLEIAIPPLRERREDILPLAEHFLAKGRSDGLRPAMSGKLQTALQAHDWPGNVRELRNAIELMRLLNSDKLIYDTQDLSITQRADGPAAEPAASGQVLGAELDKLNPKAAFRRLDRLHELFRRHRKLGRKEVAGLLGVSHVTATRDLQELCAQGFIEKIAHGKSPRTHYFALRTRPDNSPG
jgi:DNA-binding NtrC family response regulator